LKYSEDAWHCVERPLRMKDVRLLYTTPLTV
jgi:hypothetical protein